MILLKQNLKAFAVIARTGTVHAAAKQLGFTQTAITQRLKALEQELGLTLFLRSRKGMALTEDGKSLLQYCQASEELEGIFLSRVAGSERGDLSVTIAGPTSALTTRVAEGCKDLYGKYPYLRLHLRSYDQTDLVDLIRRGEADLAIVPKEQAPNEMDSKVIKPDRFLLVASPKWKGRRLQEILEKERIIDFYESDNTTKNYLKQFGLSGQLKNRLFINENQALIRFFSLGIGFGTLAETVAQPFLENGQLIALNKGQTMDDPLCLIWYPRTQKPDYFRDIISSIK